MLCRNCGKVLPESTKFCSECGASVEQQAPSVQPVQPVQMPQKKKKNAMPIVIGIAAVLVCGLIGKLIGGNVIAPSFSDDSTVSAVTPSNSTASGEYGRIFSERYIIVMPSVFTTDNYAAYAKVNENGTVYHNEYVYNDNDMVLQMIETLYYPVSNYTQEQKDVLKSTLQSTLASTLPSFCEVTWDWGYSYYRCTIDYPDLDNEANVKALVDSGIVQSIQSGTLISMNATEKDLLSDGYVKK